MPSRTRSPKAVCSRSGGGCWPRPHRRGPLEALRPGSRGWAEQVARLGPPRPAGRQCGTRPWRTTGGGGEGHGTLGLSRGHRVFRAGAPCPAISAGDSAPRVSRRSISGWPCARRWLRLVTLGASWRICTRPSPSREALTTHIGWDKSCGFLSFHFYERGAVSPRPSRPPSAPWRSPQPRETWSCTRWQTVPLATLIGFRATIGGRSTASGRPRRPSRGCGAASASARMFCLPWPRGRDLAVCHAELGTFAEGRALGRRRAPDCRGRGRTLQVSCGPRGRLVCWPSAGPPARALPLLERAVGLCRAGALLGLVPRDGGGLGGGVHTGRARCRRRAAAHARNGTDDYHGKISRSGALWSLPGGGAGAGPPPGGGVHPQALALAEELGMRPLQAHCHLGLGTLSAQSDRQSMPGAS